jgi:hypothetical protein
MVSAAAATAAAYDAASTCNRLINSIIGVEMTTAEPRSTEKLLHVLPFTHIQLRPQGDCAIELKVHYTYVDAIITWFRSSEVVLKTTVSIFITSKWWKQSIVNDVTHLSEVG